MSKDTKGYLSVTFNIHSTADVLLLMESTLTEINEAISSGADTNDRLLEYLSDIFQRWVLAKEIPFMPDAPVLELWDMDINWVEDEG